MSKRELQPHPPQNASVWFDDPKKEHVCEETDDDVVLVEYRRGWVIGFERLRTTPAGSSEGTASRFRWKSRCNEQHHGKALAEPARRVSIWNWKRTDAVIVSL